MIRWSPGMTRVERFAVLGLFLFALAAVYFLLAGCTPISAAPSDLCVAVAAGGLIQSSENPATFDVVVNREVVLRGVPAAQIQQECK